MQILSGKSRWQTINNSVSKFAGCMVQNNTRPQSGASPEDDLPIIQEFLQGFPQEFDQGFFFRVYSQMVFLLRFL